MKKIASCIACFLLFISFTTFGQNAVSLSKEQNLWLSKAEKHEKSGWIYLHIEGEAQERGFQYGYMIADEINQGISDTKINWEHLSGMEWSWLVNQGSVLFLDKIDAENLAELNSIVEGMKAAGKNISLGELIAYNGWIELNSYWWPQELKKMEIGKIPQVRESCSAFIATGSMTADGGIVMGHNTMANYHEVFCNIVLDILPDKGHRILMQTVPGWIHSGTDFFVTDAGLVGSETTIGDFDGFDTEGIPEFIRMRHATQYASNIDQWCQIMKEGNNGGYANAWLIGDIHTNEIARLELGLKYTGFEKTKDGYFTGSNIAENIKILRFETTTNESDVSDMAVARRVRWKQLMTANKGKIEIAKAKEFEAEHFDTYLMKERLGGRGLCCHAELENEDCGWPSAPYYPAGTMDGKVIDSQMAKQMSFCARWGSGCGLAFDASGFLLDHPQYDWMKGILHDRPSQPWVVFQSGEKK